MAQKFANNYITTLTGGILATDLSLPVASVAGLPAMVAGDYFYGAIVNSSNALEIFICTGLAGSNLIIPAGGRGLGGTTALNYSSGDTIRLIWCREAIQQHSQEAAQSVAATGTNVYAATFAPAIRGYVSGVTYYLQFANTNSIAIPTISFNGLPTVNITGQNGAALSSGAIPKEATLRYDGTQMILMNPVPVASGSPDSFFTE